jgi:alanyl-tRNA synthetase
MYETSNFEKKRKNIMQTDDTNKKIQFNTHNKQEDKPSHTAEHLLNQTMIRLMGCERAIEAHIEAKKSKMDFALQTEPTPEQITQIENKMNEVIAQNLPISMEYTTQTEARNKYNLQRLPDDATEQIRIVHIGDYDACPCIGLHVQNTSEIGQFKIISSNFDNGIWRVRWKLV